MSLNQHNHQKDSMDGRCFVCSGKFTLFNRENCCSLCKHSICGKCTVESVIDNTSSIKVKICLECKRERDSKAAPVVLDPPKFLQKLEELPGPSKKRPPLKKQITDDDIQSRLDALKRSGPGKKVLGKRPTEYELQSKLNKMVGRPPPVQEPVIQLYVNIKPISDQVDDLVTQVDDECKLDSQSQGATSAGKTSTGIEDLEERARALKYGTSELIAKHSTSKAEPDLGIQDLSHLTEEEQVEYLIKMTEEEAMIDLRAGVEHKSPEEEEKKLPGEEEDELPWCCVCNADAEVRCAECDNDLYCKRCFKEGHDEFDLEDHKPAIFKKTAKHKKYNMEF